MLQMLGNAVQSLKALVLGTPNPESLPPRFRPTYPSTSPDFQLVRLLPISEQECRWWYWESTQSLDKFIGLSPAQLQAESPNLFWRSIQLPPAADNYLSLVSTQFWSLDVTSVNPSGPTSVAAQSHQLAIARLLRDREEQEAFQVIRDWDFGDGKHDRALARRMLVCEPCSSVHCHRLDH